ncbi:hypothetical protein FSARC_62 [Fusarium sarcochroum]|uniref:DUF866 domain protein n=1 Tax=Fusarium sarcochroum TaxID=1208366 RepID=A0A8H4UCP0_9HYPO|nr:hypothetical protein FSARC_62 [Fusarium sarcochroum]
MFALYLTADLQGVTNLRPDDTQDNPFWYMFKVQCTSCRETHSNYVGVNRFTEPAKPQKILEFDCRGLEFTEFKPEGEWLAEGVETGTKFTGIELEEGEWFEYDEKSNEEVSINDIKWEVRRTIDFLTDAAHLLRTTAPETSSHLMSHRGQLLQQYGIALSDVQRQHTCGACGLIMIPGQEATLKIDARKSLRRKTKGTKPSADSNTKPLSETEGPCKIFHCNNCQRDTKIPLPAPGPAVRRKAAAQSKVKKASAPIEAPKQTSNATSKKRAKTRKVGLQALLSGQKQQAANPLSLSHFMK